MGRAIVLEEGLNKRGHAMKTLFFLLIVSLSLNSYAAKFEKSITGEFAQELYELAGDGDPDYAGPNELSGGCHYEKTGASFSLMFCDSEIGFILSPLADKMSDFLLKNRTPEIAEEERYAIGIHFVCEKTPTYKCEVEDLKSYYERVSQ
jgi:hypothetical protein